MKKFLLVLFVAAVMISACGSNAESAALVGKWKLTALGPADSPQPAAADIEATLTFGDDGNLSGNVGCNGFGGGYTVEGGKIVLESLAATMMACAEPQMTQEITTLRILTDSVDYKIEGNTLTISNNGEVLVLEAANSQ